MRFMLMMGMYGSGMAESGVLPNQELIDNMQRFNDEMRDAGVLIGADGLYPTSEGAKIHFRQGQAPRVQDGPFTEAKEVIGGFWMIRVKSREEAIAWARKCPGGGNSDDEGFIEIRRVYEMEDVVVDSKAQHG